MVAKEEGRGSGMDQGFGVSKYKLFNLEWISVRSSYRAQGIIFNLLG